MHVWNDNNYHHIRKYSSNLDYVTCFALQSISDELHLKWMMVENCCWHRRDERLARHKRRRKPIRTYHFWLFAFDSRAPRALFWRNYADRSSHGYRALYSATVHSSAAVSRDIESFGLSRDDSRTTSHWNAPWTRHAISSQKSTIFRLMIMAVLLTYMCCFQWAIIWAA